MSEARTKLNKRKKTLSDEKLCELGRKHFAKDFPNPERGGYPPRDELKLLAENLRNAKEFVLDHIAHCSPCYRSCSCFLRAKRRKSLATSDTSRPVFARLCKGAS